MADRIQEFTRIGMFGDIAVYGYANTEVKYNEYAFSPVEVAKIGIALKEISETALGADVDKGVKVAGIEEISKRRVRIHCAPLLFETCAMNAQITISRPGRAKPVTPHAMA